jgi:hypothetical protein
MRCLHCSKNIGVVRRLVDRQFCCDAHRRKARQIYSARAARDYAHDDAFEDGWIARATAPVKRKSASFGPGTGVLLVVVTTLMIMFLPSLGQQQYTAPVSYSAPGRGMGDRLAGLFQTRPAISLREDYKVDLRNWQGAADSLKSDWQQVGNTVRVGDLRLWKPTLPLADYNMEFAAQIENRAIGWAFRAADHGNYYATKISITAAKGTSRAEIIRYVVLDGVHLSKVQLPIPLTLANDMVYDVKVRVRGDRFTTVVNGQMVDAWSDRRLRKGGVGFFNDPGEKSSLRWVAVAERESFLQRFLSFSFFVHPAAMQARLQSEAFDNP